MMYIIHRIKLVRNLIFFFAPSVSNCFLGLFCKHVTHVRMHTRRKKKCDGSEFIGTWTRTETNWRPSIFAWSAHKHRPSNDSKHTFMNTIVTFLPSSTDVAHLPSTTSPFTSVSWFCSCGIGLNEKSCLAIAGKK